MLKMHVLSNLLVVALVLSAGVAGIGPGRPKVARTGGCG